jgi:calcineurin-like phosphoesterase family protein
MNLLLYIQITERPEDVKFFNPIISKLKEKKINTTFYDVDNHSDPLIISFANKLLSESDKKIILIDTEIESNFSKLMSLLTNLLDNPEGIEIFIRGNNTKLEKMVSILPHFTHPETTHEIEIIEQVFLKNRQL